MRSLNDVLDEINKEARSGVVACGKDNWLYYSNCLYNDGKCEFSDVLKEYENTIPPCLKIKDKESLLEAISEYLHVAKDFYGELDYDGIEDVDKYTIATALSNMSNEDFENPERFFEQRTNFLKDTTLNRFLQNRSIGYSEILGVEIEVEVRKEVIFLETPYGVYINLVKYDENGNKLKYQLPVVRYGVSDGCAYFYAIQKDQDVDDSVEKEYVSFERKIRRKMYKVNDELPKEEYSNEDIDNIHEISPWALLALTIVLGLLKQNGIDRVQAIPLLINRWNANVIYSQETLIKIREKFDKWYNEYRDHLILLRNNMDIIQRNISDKFIRNFRRVGFHFPEFMVDDYMVSMGLPLKMDIISGESCSNALLSEMFNMGFMYESGKVK